MVAFLGILPSFTPSPGFLPRYPQLKVGLQVEKSSVTRFESATSRLAVMRPTTLGKIAVKISQGKKKWSNI
jgi:hypothetical protein